ncbi:tRNA guanosine(34) transglycosylase Tgt [bacterium]|nr:tRNA guanosine(34) transglycosylase Tgt [bacterium]NBX97811.1 tRNA guanosine(34) transglycosylase Tgt [bacterium]NDC94535.1 tRNA guanosine(34) transglycosylase Tgt [bacterium]NDD83862.1 tRNA guanosine(34) transglycosylase Tgt [bacterium]NDG29929.1 tRNA guanosine(34) transglycosylase Tgt [bacterium]
MFKTTSTFGDFGRTGELTTRRGVVTTPTFMPDGTRGAVKSLTPQQVVDTGVQIVLANTYHLHLQPGEKAIKQLGGLHAFANRQGPMLTDSGGFQVFSLGKHTKISEEGVHFKDPKTGDKRFISPEISMQIQLDLGADMIVAFDHLVGLDHTVSDKEVKEAFDRTHRWLERCIAEFKRLTADMSDSERPLLFGVVQGGLDLDLRKQSLEIIQNSDVDGIAIGGLSVGETREEMTTVLQALAPLYRKDKPRFLLGVGTPEDLKIAVENGIDMLDCVLPTRNARHATVWSTNDAKIHLTNEQYSLDTSPIEPGCDCYACANGFSKAFLRHQFKVGEPLAGTLASIHNLRYMSRLCEQYCSK